MVTRVKICGLTNPADAEWAIECGADALGFVFERQSPRYVGEELSWLSSMSPLPPKVAVFGVVDRPVPKGIFDIVQGVEWECFPEPSPKRIHVVRLKPGQAPEDVLETMIHANAVLLDAYHEGKYGGSGKTVDWEQASEIVQRSSLPILLAGGLTPENVAEAIGAVRPFGVDVSSGVEDKPGLKDHAKVRDFIQAAKQA